MRLKYRPESKQVLEKAIEKDPNVEKILTSGKEVIINNNY